MKHIKLAIVALFFLFSASSGFAQIADSSTREVKLEGAVNFRDMGGYHTKEGKTVKWNKLFRSAALNQLTASDLNKLNQLSLETVIDFRGPYEVKIAPDRIPANAKRVSLPAGSEKIGDSNYLKQMMLSMKNDSGLIRFYTDLTPFHDRYKPMFDELLLLNKDSALLFHCSAGKDRTGIAAALILYALGADEKVIVADYLATNYYRRNENEKAIRGMVKFYGLDEATATNMMAAKESYIEATFTSIRKQYGTVDHFLEQVLGLTDKKIAMLKNKFLE